ncbi:MAG TPA: shikimate dehydrogenase, partial [Candidatus Lokiarchaeia archaeon]|nr:shikimate dehydrogenase [Candidatus Lokiarchaeia archaeon]
MPAITSKTQILGVIGSPIEHSVSPVMHNAAIEDLGIDFRYFAFHVPVGRLEEAIKGVRALGFAGINVTIPHKENVIGFLDEMDDTARRIGACNTIKNDDGFLTGRNTDGEGAIQAIRAAGWKLERNNVVVIGAGGAARAITYFLAKEVSRIVIMDIDKKRAKKLAAELEKVSRTTVIDSPVNDECLDREIAEADLLINATPMGMFPNVDQTPLPKKCLHEELHVFDIVYNPLETKLIQDAKEAGC